MTEEEAREKWCPFVRVAVEFNQYVGSANRGLAKDEDPHSTCIASACMAWRVRHQWFDNAQQEPEWVSFQPYAFEPGPGQERDDGFCGLAGAPQ